MTQEQKELLFKDLCARLPYGVKVYVKNWSKLDRKYYEGVYTLESAHPSLNNMHASSERFWVEVLVGYDDYEIKPYLFPLSSMTKEQRCELHDLIHNLNVLAINGEIGDWIVSSSEIDWYNKNHFDYRGLIEKGLAIDATGLNIY